MKKKLWAVLLTGAMVAAALAGCGSASEPAPAETTETPAAEVEEETAARRGKRRRLQAEDMILFLCVRL